MPADGVSGSPAPTVQTMLDVDAPTARIPSRSCVPQRRWARSRHPLQASPVTLMDTAVSSPAVALQPERITPLLADAVSDSLARAVSVQASPEAHPMFMPEPPSAPAATAAVDAMTLPTTAETVASPSSTASRASETPSNLTVVAPARRHAAPTCSSTESPSFAATPFTLDPWVLQSTKLTLISPFASRWSTKAQCARHVSTRDRKSCLPITVDAGRARHFAA